MIVRGNLRYSIRGLDETCRHATGASTLREGEYSSVLNTTLYWCSPSLTVRIDPPRSQTLTLRIFVAVLVEPRSKSNLRNLSHDVREVITIKFHFAFVIEQYEAGQELQRDRVLSGLSSVYQGGFLITEL